MKLRIPKWVKPEMVVGLIALTALLVEPIMDLLPIDQSHWLKRNGQYYYYSEKGDRVTGWEEIDAERYYLDPAADGAMYTGWLALDGKHYYLNENGRCLTGWQEIDGAQYCLRTDGSAVTGWYDWEDGRYYFDEKGMMQTGWVELEEGRFYLDENGKTVTGWLGYEGKQYYLDETGCATVGWITLNDGKHYFGADGAAQTGWLYEGDERRYFDNVGRLKTGWLALNEGKYYLDSHGYPVTGQMELDGVSYYLGEDGVLTTGWVQQEDQWYYYGSNGMLSTGWIELDGQQYYLQEDGTAANGYVRMDGQIYCFSAKGAPILLVNRWRELPRDYEVELVETVDGAVVAKSCEAALLQMLEDCKKAGGSPMICSSYRTIEMQESLFWRQVDIWRDTGLSANDAYDAAMQVVAIPGTSEHHTGLAVDITDTEYTLLDEQQGQTKTQQWLMEHCWEYGFILRYPEETTDWTGIIYEPWHYRYVGKELSMELYELDICLEEYLLRMSPEEML